MLSRFGGAPSTILDGVSLGLITVGLSILMLIQGSKILGLP